MASSETQGRDTHSSQIVFALVPLNELRRPPPKTNKKAHFFYLQDTRVSDRYMGTGHSKLPRVDLVENYETMSVNPEDYEGQTVLILGK